MIGKIPDTVLLNLLINNYFKNNDQLPLWDIVLLLFYDSFSVGYSLHYRPPVFQLVIPFYSL